MDLPDDQTQTPETVGFASSSVASATYTPEQQTLEVTFVRDGSTYTYSPVSAEEWWQMRTAPSVGRWVRQVLAGRESL